MCNMFGGPINCSGDDELYIYTCAHTHTHTHTHTRADRSAQYRNGTVDCASIVSNRNGSLNPD